MMSITVTPVFRSRRESATPSQQGLGVTVLGFSLETEKGLYTCGAFNWEKNLGYEDVPLHSTQADPQRVVGFTWLVYHGFTVLHGVYFVRPQTLFNRPKYPLTKHRVCLMTLMNIACSTTSRFVRGGVTWPPATWSCTVRNVNNSMAWIFMKDVRHILWPCRSKFNEAVFSLSSCSADSL